MFVGIFPERFHAAFNSLFAAFQLGKFGLNFTAPFGILTNLLVLFVFFDRKPVNFLLIIDELFLHGVDNIHVLFKRCVYFVNLALYAVPLLLEIIDIR